MKNTLLIIILILIIFILYILFLNKKEDYQPIKNEKSIFSTENIDPISFITFGSFGFTWKDLIRIYESSKQGQELSNKISRQYFKVTVPQLKNLLGYSYVWNDDDNPNWITNYNYFVELITILGGINNTSSLNLEPEMKLINLNNIPHKFLKGFGGFGEDQLKILVKGNQIKGDKYILFTYISNNDQLSNKLPKVITTIQVYIRKTVGNMSILEKLDNLVKKIEEDDERNIFIGPSVKAYDIRLLSRPNLSGKIYNFNLKVGIATSKDLLNVEWNIKSSKKEKEEEKENY